MKELRVRSIVPVIIRTPLLVRGAYYDQWRPSDQPERYRSLEEFLRCVVGNLGAVRPVNPRDATRAVFDVLSRHIADRQVRKVREALPEEVRTLWRGPSQESGQGGPVTAEPERVRNIRS